MAAPRKRPASPAPPRDAGEPHSPDTTPATSTQGRYRRVFACAAELSESPDEEPATVTRAGAD